MGIRMSRARRAGQAKRDADSPRSVTLADALLGTLDEKAARQLAERLRPHLPVGTDRFLDARQAADILGLHPDTLVRMARTGRIWAQKVGREWRFRADRLEVQPICGEAGHPFSVSRRRADQTPRSSVAAIRGIT